MSTFQRNQSSCSYCRDTSHNIRGCNHASIGDLYNNYRLLFIYVTMLGQPEEETRNLFVGTLCRSFNLPQLKAVAVRSAGARSDQTKVNYAFYLWLHFLGVAVAAQQPDPVIAEQEHVRYFNQALAEVEVDFHIHQQVFAAAAEETDDFIPLNLNSAFEAAAATPIKKYRINPILFCSETDEELEVASECHICYDSVKLFDSVILNCDHQFCRQCIKDMCQLTAQKRHLNCPLCREPISSFIAKSDEVYEAIAEHCVV